MNWQVLCSVVLLFALSSCRPDAFNKQKYTRFKGGLTVRLHRPAKLIVSGEKPACDNGIFPKAHKIKGEIEAERDTRESVIHLDTISGYSETDLKNGNYKDAVTSKKTISYIPRTLYEERTSKNAVRIKASGETAPQPGRVYEVIASVIILLMALALIVSLFTMIFLGYPSVGLFFLFLGGFFVIAFIFGISMLGCRSPEVRDHWE